PAGVLYVRHIYLLYTDDQLTSLDELQSDLADAEEALAANADQPEIAAKKADLESEIAGIRGSLADRMAEVQAKLAAGAGFDELMAQYGEDQAMQEEPFRSRGMAITAASEAQDPAYTAAAMALATVGAVSEPVYADYGVYLIEYVGDAPAGPVALGDIHDALYEEALAFKKEDAYVAAMDQWIEEAEVQYFYENMN
ncbi:MAG: hypothetical protein GX558_00960, partial [Clostridiales bacterium]|nr:hypothetical protein [Clostridiales bacterium]